MGEKSDLVVKKDGTVAREQEAVERVTRIPNTDIFEDEEKYYLAADMPGVDKSGVDIPLEKGVLTIRGSMAPRNHEGRPVIEEAAYGDFERSFRLSDAIDDEGIEARMEDGVLQLTLPKAGPARTKRIPVATD